MIKFLSTDLRTSSENMLKALFKALKLDKSENENIFMVNLIVIIILALQF